MQCNIDPLQFAYRNKRSTDDALLYRGWTMKLKNLVSQHNNLLEW